MNSSNLKDKPVSKLSVIIPVFNEKGTVREAIKGVLNAPIDLAIELLVVDDGSTDGSTRIIKELASQYSNIVPIILDENRGKGHAIRTAFQEMTGDVALIHDADLEYSVSDYPQLLKPILEANADVVFGSRFLVKDETRVMLFWHRLTNKLITFLVNICTNMTYTDVETCFKAARTDILKKLYLVEDRFGIEIELTIKLSKWGLRIVEVPVSYRGRTVYEGKKIGFSDGFHALWAIVKYSFLRPSFATDKGFLILKALEHNTNYNNWLFSMIKPFLGNNNILEVGAGIGTISKYLLQYDNVALTDIAPFYLEVLQRRYAHLENVSVHYFDITQPIQAGEMLSFKPNSILCINILEHIREVGKTLTSFQKLLPPGGRIIILIPQGQHLFGAIDQAVGHHKRFSIEEMKTCLNDSGLEVEYLITFNKFTVPLWYVQTCVFKRARIGPVSSTIHNLMIPIMRPLDKVLPWKGLSILAIGRKPETYQ